MPGTCHYKRGRPLLTKLNWIFSVCMLLLTLNVVPSATHATTTNAIPNCPAHYSIDVTMAIGTRWEMCWGHDAQRGLVLNEISFTPKNGNRMLILGSAALAQIYVAYDDASQTKHYLSDTGLSLATLTTSDCPNGLLRQDSNGNNVLCQIVRARGYAWRGSGHVSGQSLVIFAVSHVDNDSYIHQWVFNDDGTIMPMLGVSGRLNQNRISNANTGWPLGNGNTRYATSRFHTAYWRLNFDIGGSANDVVEQFDYSGTGTVRTQIISNIWQESARVVSPLGQRFWRVKDAQLTNANGHNLSYQIVPQQAAVHRGSEGFTRNDVYVTTHKSCEQFASRNPTYTGCDADVIAFTNGELVTDVVVWVGTTWHQVARDEDEPFVPVHWQSITLMPRDFMFTSPLQ
jgi:primary-amine oxidase